MHDGAALKRLPARRQRGRARMLLPAAAPRGLNPERILRGHRPDMGQVQPNRQVIGVASMAATPAVPARKSAGCETQSPAAVRARA